MVELPSRIKGLHEGFSIDLYATDNKEVLVVAATNSDGESIQVPLGMAMATALAGSLLEWVDQAVHKKPDSEA